VFPRGSDRITLAIGIEHWREGETTLSVDARGHAAITNRRAGAETRFDGTLTTEQVKDLCAAVDAILNLRREATPKQPGDVPLKISVYAGPREIGHNNTFSYSDRYDTPGVNEVIRRFNELVNRISNGALAT